MKNSIDIQQHIYKTIRDYVESKITGKVYLQGCRPLNSTLEDAVIGVSTISGGQVQDGRARINIYCADINAGGKRLVPNLSRLHELSAMTNTIVEMLEDADAEYEWNVFQAPQIEAELDIKQHFVSIGLEFRIMTF